MTRILLMAALVCAAALAGCAAGDPESQLPTGLPGDQGAETDGAGPDAGSNDTGDSANATPAANVTLEVDPDDGSAPLNVTLRYDADDADNSSANLTWTLRMWRSGPPAPAPADDAAGNGTGNGTGNATTGGSSGNATGNSTGNGTTSATATSSSSPASSGNGTAGNGTGNSTGNATTGGSSGNATGNGTAEFTLAINGTSVDLPGLTTHRINATGHYQVTFTVTFGNGTVVERNATMDVRAVPPGTALGNETSEFSGSFLASEPVLCLASEEFEWALNDTKDDVPAEVDQVWATLEGSGVSDYTLTLTAPNGTEIASGPELNATGPFEAGNYTLAVESCVAIDTEFVLTAIASYVARAVE